MSAALGLDPLLAALREAGLPVGVSEVARLRQVFALGPRLEAPEARRLKAILCAVLVKSTEDRARFEPVFEAWLERAGQELHLRQAPAGESRRLEEPRPALRPRRYLWRVLMVVVLLGLSLMFSDHNKAPQKSIPAATPPEPATTPNPVDTPANATAPPAQPAAAILPDTRTAPLTAVDIRQRRFNAWVPTLSITSPDATRKGWQAFILGCLGLLATVSLWLVQRQRSGLPEPKPEPLKKGPPRVFLTPPKLVGPQLLEPKEQEALIWGIGHFVADEPVRRLDLRATVRKTSLAGGVPHLVFQQARHPREVWLWIDEAADDLAIPRFAAEVEMALQTHGLPVERSFFRGIPDWLVSSVGQAFAPNEVDERRDSALVAILTDGRVLARYYKADDHRVRLDTLLRSLSHWPRLAIVDFSEAPGDLAGILAKHSLVSITPAGLAAFLGNDEAASRKAPATAVTGDTTWAAVCALSPASVDEARAFEIRQRLHLATSPWALRTLRAEAPGSPGRLEWRSEDRVRRINWLRDAEAQPTSGIASGSRLEKAIRYWEDTYDQELSDRERGAAPWLETPAHQHLAMERALLALWRDPPNATRQLYQLHGGVLREIIERHLHDMAPADWGGPEHIHLPWTWAERTDAEQVLLNEMKLGGGMPVTALRRPGRLWLGLGICLGLTAGAFGIAALCAWRQPVGPPSVAHGPGKPADALQEIRKTSAGLWRVTVATRKSLATLLAPAGARVDVHWDKRRLPCVAELHGAEEWSCGTIENPSRANESIGRRVFGLVAPPGTPEANALAVELLDSGSADLVFIGRAPSRYSTGLSPAVQEVLILPGSKWETLRQALWFEGIQTVHQVWPSVRLLAGAPAARLRGLAEFIHVNPGTFTMGSDDPLADPDDKPAHEVTLSEFWIGKTEVSNEQYRADHHEYQGRPDNLPASRVSWDEAKDFCERHGWRLPTEAEWEYAARAGTQTAWSFGTDEKKAGDFAWFAGNSDSEPHPVGTKKPNPWGIYDLHGNAWEWVEDRYGPYNSDPQTDPKGPDAGEARSVRGGSFYSSPKEMRSSVRFWDDPWDRDKIGFRCAHGVRRQP